jgi:hypothetical protein
VVGVLGRMVRVSVIERRINKLGGGLHKQITVHEPAGPQLNTVNFEGGNAMAMLPAAPNPNANLAWPINHPAIAKAQLEQQQLAAQKAQKKANQQKIQADKEAAKKKATEDQAAAAAKKKQDKEDIQQKKKTK